MLLTLHRATTNLKLATLSRVSCDEPLRSSVRPKDKVEFGLSGALSGNLNLSQQRLGAVIARGGQGVGCGPSL